MEGAGPCCRVRSALVGHLTGDTLAPATTINGKDASGKDALVSNPEYEEWYAKDQQILSFVLIQLGRDVLAQVAAQGTTTKLWAAIEGM